MQNAFGFTAAAGCALVAGSPKLASARSARLVKIVLFTDTGQRKGVVEVEKVIKSDTEWRQQLTPEEYQVTRRAGTERAFTGRYWDNHEHGLYRCVCCGTALFR